MDRSESRPSAMAPARPRRTVLTLLVGALSAALVACGGDHAQPPPPADPSSLRSLPAGDVVGFTGRYGSHAWIGLPFAMPPTGKDRWRSPRPARRWDGVREALEFGSPCAQLATPFAGVVDQEPGTFAGSEDCLYLNVYAPTMQPDAIPTGDELLPVMVWIHGGGNSVGHASFYDGGLLAQSQNVVVVTINYRLGPFGFFRHESLRASAADAAEASGNFGILDQILALEWVRDNVSVFGGDADNVTIFGESAGARDVLALVLSPMAAGLFDRAIVQSGSARELPLDEAEAFSDSPAGGLPNSSNEILARLLVAHGRAVDRADARASLAATSAAEIEGFLRETSAEDLLAAYMPDDAEGIPDVPNVFADGKVLPSAPPLEVLATPGAFNDVPIMFGTNRDETRIFMFASSEYTRQLLGFLPRLRDPDAFDGAADVASLAWKLVGADAPANVMRRSGAKDVYVYRWDWDEEPSVLGADLGEMIGASHGFEIPFVFGHYDLGPRANVVWNDANRAGRDVLSGQMMSYWSEFARSGRPGTGRRGDLIEWTRWEPESGAPKFLLLDTPADGGLRMSSQAVTPRDVIARVKDDSRLVGTRCDVAVRTSRTLAGIGAPPVDIPGCVASTMAARD